MLQNRRKKQATILLRNYFNKLKNGDTTAQNLRMMQEQIQANPKLEYAGDSKEKQYSSEIQLMSLTIIITFAGNCFSYCLYFSCKFSFDYYQPDY